MTVAVPGVTLIAKSFGGGAAGLNSAMPAAQYIDFAKPAVNVCGVTVLTARQL